MATLNNQRVVILDKTMFRSTNNQLSLFDFPLVVSSLGNSTASAPHSAHSLKISTRTLDTWVCLNMGYLQFHQNMTRFLIK